MTSALRTSDGTLLIPCRLCLVPINALDLKDHQVMIDTHRLVEATHLYHASTGNMYKERLLAMGTRVVSRISRIRPNKTVAQFRRRSRSLYGIPHCIFCGQLQPLEDLALHEVLLSFYSFGFSIFRSIWLSSMHALAKKKFGR